QKCLPIFPTLKCFQGNICSSDLVNYVLAEEKIDTIMHFAAQTHVGMLTWLGERLWWYHDQRLKHFAWLLHTDNSFGNSFQFTVNNIYGTHVLLESAKLHKIKRFIHVSTDEVYGEANEDQEPMFESQ